MITWDLMKNLETWKSSVPTKMLDFPAKLLLEVSQRRHFFAYSEDNLGVRAETTHNSDIHAKKDFCCGDGYLGKKNCGKFGLKMA